MLLMLVAAALLLVLIVIVVGIIAFVKMNRTTHGSSSTFSESNSSHFNSGSHLPSQENDHLPSGDHQHFSSNGPRDTFYKDELNDNCCCEDDCCDQMLLTQGSKDIRNQYQPSSDFQSSSKGPPDIIPSFGYVLDPTTGAATICGALGMDPDKMASEHFITYGNNFRCVNDEQLIIPISLDAEPVIPYTQNLTVEVEPLQYAEISFATSSQSSSSCHTIPPQVHSGSRISFIANDQQQYHKVTPPVRGPQSSDYARIEFTKSSRVSVLGGSPKFESTV